MPKLTARKWRSQNLNPGLHTFQINGLFHNSHSLAHTACPLLSHLGMISQGWGLAGGKKGSFRTPQGHPTCGKHNGKPPELRRKARPGSPCPNEGIIVPPWEDPPREQGSQHDKGFALSLTLPHCVSGQGRSLQAGQHALAW